MAGLRFELVHTNLTLNSVCCRGPPAFLSFLQGKATRPCKYATNLCGAPCCRMQWAVPAQRIAAATNGLLAFSPPSTEAGTPQTLHFAFRAGHARAWRDSLARISALKSSQRTMH